ncbi:unnamed protein product [Protopolystoma xenopodis]|uniref:Uncharacterized protein n=1 Tax=Protopolystoma xenopodis TaxID=117903 RepID=A0A3S5B0A3_9PLAT|nr:unnamed protein product [Protopolystoma xenopodis]
MQGQRLQKPCQWYLAGPTRFQQLDGKYTERVGWTHGSHVGLDVVVPSSRGAWSCSALGLPLQHVHHNSRSRGRLREQTRRSGRLEVGQSPNPQTRDQQGPVGRGVSVNPFRVSESRELAHRLAKS